MSVHYIVLGESNSYIYVAIGKSRKILQIISVKSIESEVSISWKCLKRIRLKEGSHIIFEKFIMFHNHMHLFASNCTLKDIKNM